MILFHRTTLDRARAILAAAFRDETATYMTDQEWTGVWLSDVPLDANEGASGECVLQVNTSDVSETELADYEWIEDGKTYRECLLRADLINSRMSVKLYEEPSE